MLPQGWNGVRNKKYCLSVLLYVMCKLRWPVTVFSLFQHLNTALIKAVLVVLIYMCLSRHLILTLLALILHVQALLFDKFIYYKLSFLPLCRNHHDMNEWIEATNLVAATYSAPPLPAPVGSWYNKMTSTHSMIKP